MDAMNGRADNEGALSLQEYGAMIEIEHLDRNDQVLATWQLNQAFPINLSEIALQYAQNDILEEYTVTFQYQDYEYQK